MSEAPARRSAEIALPASLAVRLDALPDGSTVPILRTVGSLCPVTTAHVSLLIEARRFLLGAEPGPGVFLPRPRPATLGVFGEVLAYLGINGDGHVARKLAAKGEESLGLADRHRLAGLATDEHDWLFLQPIRRGRNLLLDEVKRRWPCLSFVRIDVNGADDVAKYRKWESSVGKPAHRRRQIVMGRPGYTQVCIDGAAAAGADDAYCIIGPEVPGDVSSTQVRHLIRTGRLAEARKFLHPDVYEWHVSAGFNYQPQQPASLDEPLGCRDKGP